MNLDIKKRAVLIGAFILIAYGVLVYLVVKTKIVVMIADIVSGIAVIGIAVLIYPIFKNFRKNLSIVYLYLKILEGGLMITGGVLFLFDSLQHLRNTIYEGIHLFAFIISAFIFYFLLYESKAVPRFISVWGAAAILALSIRTVLNIAGISYPAIDFLLILIITNEVFLALWLMTRGFSIQWTEKT